MNFALLSALMLGCADAGLVLAASSAPAPSVEIAMLAQPEPSTVPAAEPSAEEKQARPAAFEGESDEAVVKRLFDYLEATTTLQGNFTQIAPSGAVSTGKIYIRRPGFARFEYDPPNPLLIVANGGLVYERQFEDEPANSYPLGKTPLKFLLSKRVELGDAQIVAVHRDDQSVAVTMASADGETEGKLTVVFSAPDIELREWVFHDARDGVTVFTIKDLVEGADIPNRLFAAPKSDSTFLKN